MITITNDQLLEGFLGALGWVLFWYYFKNRAQYSIVVEGFIAWTLVWWLRKIGINLYRNFKKNKD